MNSIVKDICKIGQDSKCCRYLAADENGFLCAKMNNEFKNHIDENWEKVIHVAQGDNCDGHLQNVLNDENII